MKIFISLGLLALSFTGFSQQKIFKITDFGAKPGGSNNNTESIQKAIDAAGASGGTVYIPAGTFLTGVITMRSNVTLNLDANAVLLASPVRADYGDSEASPVIVANNVHNIAINGKGTIDGNGAELLKDLMSRLNAGTLKDDAWGKLNPWHQMQPQESNRPKIIGFSNCKNILIKGITLKNGLDWVQDYVKCIDLVVDSINVESNTYWNNDGIDLVDCKNVQLTHSFFNADDDGICLKSESRDGMCENIYIADCIVRSSASGIKFGTASHGGFKKVVIKNVKIYDTYRSAIALESVDGGTMEDIDISNIDAVNTGNAIFIRVGHRNNDSVYSSVNRIHISNVNVDVPAGKPDAGYPMEGPIVRFPHNEFPSSIMGLPGHPVKNVVLENIHITYHGNADKAVAHFGLDSLNKLPENVKGYPEFSMFGEMPAWGFYTRHAEGVTFKNITLNCLGIDFRPACIFDDVSGLTLDNITIPQVKAIPVILVNKVTGYTSNELKIPGNDKNKVQVK